MQIIYVPWGEPLAGAKHINSVRCLYKLCKHLMLHIVREFGITDWMYNA